MATNQEIIDSIEQVRGQVESLRRSMEEHQRSVSIALAGDYTQPESKPGLIQRVGRHIVECDEDRRKLWGGLKICMTVILILLGWVVAGKVVASEPAKPPASRIVNTP